MRHARFVLIVVAAFAYLTQPSALGLQAADLPTGNDAGVLPVRDGLALWLTADSIAAADPTQVQSVDGRNFVLRWIDQSQSKAEPVAAAQTDAGRRPVLISDALNGHSVVRFDRARRDVLLNNQTNLLEPGSPRTIVVVGQAKVRPDGGSGGTLFTFRLDSEGQKPVFTVQQWLFGQHYVYSDAITGGGNASIPTAAATRICSPFVSMLRSAGVGSQIAVDLNGISQTVSGGTIVAEQGGTGFAVGNREDVGAKGIQGWDGDLAEILIYGRELTVAELDAVGLYLTQKYGLVTEYKSLNLPPAAVATVDFKSDVFPILKNHCFDCHSGKENDSGYRLDQRDEWLGLNNGMPLAAIGQSGRSRAIHLVSSAIHDKKMPPEGEGEPLETEQIGILRAWIDQGLKWDCELLPPLSAEINHWAFKPIEQPTPPSVQNASWVQTPADAFIAAAHQEKQIQPNREASRRELIRRLSFDLIGLPPTAEEVEAFASSTSPTAYEELVDRLLASPHYGERWARHWLDLVRWADTEGYEMNHPRPFAWRYRDYVVKSFNDDKPYDQFLRQQIAGDEMLPYSDENLIATGFLASARFSTNEDNLKRQWQDVLIDITNATGSAVMGLTMGCAQCHNHKFDPITQRDYFRLQGFFVKGQLLNLAIKDPQLWSEWEALKDEKAPKPQTVGFYSPLSPTPVEVLKMEAVFPLPYNPDELRRTEGVLYVRGDLESPGPVVGAGWPAVFGETLDGAPLDEAKLKRSPRTALVDWLVHSKNPLTARVWANRIWKYHFGRGIVDPPSDFGVKGSEPTHPELLHWLAAELMRSGWSTKHLHRMILLSSTYRQSSAYSDASAKADPDNRLWWRWQPRRLESEILRDSMLIATGELKQQLGGPSIPLDQDAKTLRRSLYLLQDRNSLPDMQAQFDAPNGTDSCPGRPTSTVPLQPLYLLNNSYMVDRARSLAERVLRVAGNDPTRQVEAAFRFSLARTPEPEEHAVALRYLSGAANDVIPVRTLWDGANWVWDHPQANTVAQSPAPRYLRKTIELSEAPVHAKMIVTCDDQYVLHVNGQRVGAASDWSSPESYDIAGLLKPGKNVIGLEAINGTGGAGIIAWSEMSADSTTTDRASGSSTVVATNATWKISTTAETDWTKPEFDDADWSAARVLGNADTAPWHLAPVPTVSASTVPKRLIHFCQTLLNLNEFFYVN